MNVLHDGLIYKYKNLPIYLFKYDEGKLAENQVKDSTSINVILI